MSRFAEALDLDLRQDVLPCAAAYTDAMVEPSAPLEVFINLAFLYWNCTDPGFSGAHHLDSQFVRLAGDRYGEVLQAALTRWPHAVEPQFWEKYFDFAGLGGPDFVDECLGWAQAPGAPDVLALHIYDQTGDERWLPTVARLLREAEHCPTTKNRYIASVLRGDLQRLGHQIST